MINLKTISIVILFTLISASLGNSQTNKETHNILVLFAQQPNTPAYPHILDGIRQRLTEKFGDSYNLFTEYLEKDLYPQGEYPKERFDSYNDKYDNSDIDLLICVGVNIIDIINKYATDYLLQLPVVSMDLDFSAYGYKSFLSLNQKTAEIRLNLNVEKTINEALSLFPKTESVYFISGVSSLDKLLYSISKQVAEKIIKNKKITFISDVSMDETIKLVHTLPVNSIIFVPNYNIDGKQLKYFNNEAVRLISQATNAPVFTYTSTGFGEGAVGGYTLDFARVGLIGGEAAVNILNGTNPNSIKFTEKDYYDYIFDWRELKRWHLENSELIPKGSTILFEQSSTLDKYKWMIGIALLFLVLQSSLIVNLIRLNRNQKKMTRQIIEEKNKYRDFLHEDRSLRLGQLAASLSHELNQPLTAILSNAQAAINFINSNEATPELLKQILHRIVDNDKRTASILNSIRGMLKLENREKEKVNLNSVINEVAQVYKGEANKLNIEMSINLLLEPVYIWADRIQIEQVLLNLFFNASQSFEKIKVKNKMIIINLLIKDEDIIVSVRDNGSGINEAMKEKLFSPFATSKMVGMGIGLAICRSIIDDHRGKIWAENLPGGGAEFSFSLKMVKDE